VKILQNYTEKYAFLCILEASFRQYCFYIFLFLGSEGVAMAQWPPHPYASANASAVVLKLGSIEPLGFAGSVSGVR